MAIAQHMRNNVRWSFQPHVLAACGEAIKFGPIERQVAEWIESGDNAPPATATTVPRYLAGYLADATAAGRRWGRQIGAAAGVLIGLLVSIVVLVAW